MKQHKTKRKRLLVLALCLLTALSMLPVTAMAEDSGTMNPAFTISKVEIEDSIETNGRFTLKVTDSNNNVVAVDGLKDAGYTITWKRDGTVVKRVKVTGDKYNMAADGSCLNVAYDQGAQKSYTVTVSKDNEIHTSAPMNADWYDELQNPSFEEPVLAAASDSSHVTVWPALDGSPAIQYIKQENVPGWKTTVETDCVLTEPSTGEDASYGTAHWIEIGNVEKQYNNRNPYNCDKAKHGYQVAELNAIEHGALYQDVLTVPTSTMKWQVGHRGRLGDDTMALVIAPLSEVKSLTEQNALKKYIDDRLQNATEYNGGGVFIKTFKGDNEKWGEYTGSYKVPDGQFATRYFFVAMESHGANLSHGNLLDDLGFETTTPLPSDEQGRLTIEKKIKGLSKTQAEKLIKNEFISYKIGTDSAWKTVLLTNPTNNTGDSFTATYTVDITVPANSAGVEVIVKEDPTKARVEGYKLNTDGTDEKSVTIQERETQTITFTNSYEMIPPNTGTLIVKKTVTGGGADYDKEFTFAVELKRPQQPEAKAVTLMNDMPNNGGPSIDNQNDSEPITFGGVNFVRKDDAIVGEFTLQNGKEQRLDGIPAGVTYTVTESDNAGYTVTVNNTSEPSATGKIVAGKTVTVTFNNHKDGGYTPGPTYYPLTIQKVVTGLESVPAGYKATVNVMSKYSSVPTRTLMLEPNKPQTVHLPYGEYTLTETAPAVDGYKLTGQTFSETTFMLTYGGKNVTITNAYTKEQEEPVVIPDDPMAPEDDKPDKPSKPKDDTSKVPKTGDDTPLSLALYGLIAAGALLCIRKAAKRKIK